MITQEYLKEALDYNPENGCLIWKERPESHFNNKQAYSAWNSKFAGKRAGSLCENRYFQIVISYKRYWAHRVIWLLVYGYFPKYVDHKNRNGLDNRLKNLRECSQSENLQNQKKPHKNNRSGFLGVKKTDKGFVARISINGKDKYLGTFKTPEEAHAAYLAKKRALHDFCTI